MDFTLPGLECLEPVFGLVLDCPALDSLHASRGKLSGTTPLRPSRQIRAGGPGNWGAAARAEVPSMKLSAVSESGSKGRERECRCRTESSLPGLTLSTMDKGMDVNVHGFGPGQIPLQRAPGGQFRIWGTGRRDAVAPGRSEIGVPRLFYSSIHRSFCLLHRLDLMREKHSLLK